MNIMSLFQVFLSPQEMFVAFVQQKPLFYEN